MLHSGTLTLSTAASLNITVKPNAQVMRFLLPRLGCSFDFGTRKGKRKRDEVTDGEVADWEAMDDDDNEFLEVCTPEPEDGSSRG